LNKNFGQEYTQKPALFATVDFIIRGFNSTGSHDSRGMASNHYPYMIADVMLVSFEKPFDTPSHPPEPLANRPACLLCRLASLLAHFFETPAHFLATFLERLAGPLAHFLEALANLLPAMFEGIVGPERKCQQKYHGGRKHALSHKNVLPAYVTERQTLDRGAVKTPEKSS
jgi:hypothetical protein